MATPHIEALKGDIAETVLMPGDPLRAKFIAETFLKDVVMFNDVRNMLGYTGYYKGRKVSVMGSGMGIPSIGIYSYELFKFYDVKKIIRVGSCGALVPDLDLFDIVLATKAYSESSYAKVQNNYKESFIESSKTLTNKIEKTAKKIGINITKGIVYSTDVFYKEKPNLEEVVNSYNCIAVEMEAFALFHNARILKKEAACILTVSDSLITKEKTTSEEREKHFIEMIKLALESI
jgi:purine-nucleoside phosphorylase